ncbi:hypothetical protein SAMN05421837_103727 [Amycolatopsis pretoriensis]|uniref:Uncharacterized protein n=1 Tax=Amycolatopsis pretoriensis TaxID=218821 RepID=A0A1H5QQ30_9PSEU|nr:hypothetical protein SAMN05421837_103727 [Amycolatopsis pretoriensis]
MVFLLLVSWLAGDAFRTAEQVSTLIVDLRPPNDQNAIDLQVTHHKQFSGNVFLVVGENARIPCEKTVGTGGGARPGGMVGIAAYCPLPFPSPTTVVLGGAPTPESVADLAGRLSVTVLETDGRVYEAGRAQGGFAWYAALLTGGALLIALLALQNVTSPRKRRATPVPRHPPRTQLGDSVIDHRYPPRPGGDAVAPPGPPPPPAIPRRPPPGEPPPAPAPWSPPVPARIALPPAGSSVLPELARIIRDAGGRAVARTHIDAPGGYVAVGDVVLWAASPAGGVLPGEPVGLEYTGDPAAPLTISATPSRSVPEQGYHR